MAFEQRAHFRRIDQAPEPALEESLLFGLARTDKAARRGLSAERGEESALRHRPPNCGADGPRCIGDSGKIDMRAKIGVAWIVEHADRLVLAQAAQGWAIPAREIAVIDKQCGAG